MEENKKEQQVVEEIDELEDRNQQEESFDAELEEEIISEVGNSEMEALQTEIETLTKEKEELQQKIMRVQADFDNFRKRSKRERENDLKYKSQDFAMELLPVVDNFERALQVKVEEESLKNFVEGMNMIYRQLLQAFNKVGVEEIEAEGQPFDPELHQAVMQVKEEDKESNIILEVLQKGYRLKDRVIRPTMVKVNE